MLGFLNSNVVAYEDGRQEQIICRTCANERWGAIPTDNIRLGLPAEEVRGVSEAEVVERGLVSGAGTNPVCDHCSHTFDTISTANGWV